MTSKDCHHHNHSSVLRKIIPRSINSIALMISIILLVIALLLVMLIVCVMIHPSKPSFILQDATVLSFDVTGDPPRFLNSGFQVTISSRNPNGKSGIYYDHLDVYASYRDQPITIMTSINSTTYQGHKEVNVWSLLIGGNSVPVAPFKNVSFDMESLMVHIDGRVRWKWKVGLPTKTYHLYIRCPAKNHSGDSAAGVNVGNNASFNTACSVVVV